MIPVFCLVFCWAEGGAVRSSLGSCYLDDALFAMCVYTCPIILHMCIYTYICVCVCLDVCDFLLCTCVCLFAGYVGRRAPAPPPEVNAGETV